MKYTINGYNLDKYQERAITSDKENILLIAGAGSGKTLTILGKIKYLIEEKNIKCEDILCISFTNECVNNLKNNLDYNVDVFTFHKLALNIIKDNNKNISICDNDLLNYIIDEFFYRNIKSKKLLMTDEYKKIKILISTFINLFKTGNYSLETFNNILKSLKYSNRYILI